MHKSIEKMLPLWSLMDDCLEGEHQIKNRHTKYLPKTQGMLELELRGIGVKVYENYLFRASFPNWLQQTLEANLGICSSLPITTNLDSKAVITQDGFCYDVLYTRLLRDVFTKGRAILLADYNDTGSPVLVQIEPANLVDWKTYGGEFVYAEIHQEDGFKRVLTLDEEGRYVSQLFDVSEKEPRLIETGYPSFDAIPLVAIGSNDNNPEVDTIPLLEVANSALKYYRLSADLEQVNHLSATPQAYIAGVESDDINVALTGPGSVWTLPEGTQVGYLEFSGSGAESIRKSIEATVERAMNAGARLLSQSRSNESGDALRIRRDSSQAGLYSVVNNTASGIHKVLGFYGQDFTFDVEVNFSNQVIDQATVQIVRDLYLNGEVSRQTLLSVLNKNGVDVSHEPVE